MFRWKDIRKEQTRIPARTADMPCKRMCLALTLVLLIGTTSMAYSLPSDAKGVPALDFRAASNDPFAGAIREDADASVQQIQEFFRGPFTDPIHFVLVDRRADFDAAVMKFGLSPTQCWMVGMGTADLMVVLSPKDWKDEACEHDASDAEAIQQLVKHELIHVYHGQLNPSRDFTGIEDLDWFIEGVAVYGSEQLTPTRLEQMHAAVVTGQLPDALSKIWTGPNRYGFAGSLVRYIDQRWGRATTIQLLKTRSSAEALGILGTDEKTLLAGWRKSLAQ